MSAPPACLGGYPANRQIPVGLWIYTIPHRLPRELTYGRQRMRPLLCLAARTGPVAADARHNEEL
ncbi:uncharacterized protein N7500_005198 [Penicillium coprophilum]|uniref:uncharacterized protein n=1 Tax=Penicillium coprophilum TaxID=36646 RepID=UPI0023891E68|nr:uncharacterized protein N7500_005198 [Penicillium coprophilum]KAJ5163368.1 hypothetical protein N7500_005198 [Penicillium coprophilum]